MSNVIDSRVVEMRFDNQQFEKGVQQSMGTLDKLKQSLNFSDVNVADKINLSEIGTALSSVGEKFTAFEAIALGALTRIGSQAIELGEKIVKSLSIDQLAAGWDKYEQKTTSVQTIMAATASQFTDTGEQMDYVNQQLEKLNWFTDETSYNFVDMVGNIGKFTSNGIKLDAAVTSMQGIANWAAISGQNATTASRAMYNLAQAIGVGTVKLIDWRSIETANMATVEFKENVLETAANLKTLIKTADGFETVGKHTKVSIENFSSALNEGWFTKEVLQQTLDMYGAATNKLYNLAQVSGLTATELLTLVRAQKEGKISNEDFEAACKRTGYSVSDLKAGIKELAKDEYDLGIRSLIAAQEAKTFSEAIGSVKDAVSTGWMKSFELMFGDYETARVFWTDMANALWDIFASGSEARNILLSNWSTSGWDKLVSSIKQTSLSMDTFEQGVRLALYNSGVDVDHLIDEYGSLSNAIKLGAINAYDLAEAVKYSISSAVNNFDSIYNTEEQLKRIQEIEKELIEFAKGGAVDLLKRPIIDASVLQNAGWKEAAEGAATVFTSTFTNKAGDVAANFTPIMVDENGKHIGTLSPEELTKYAEEVLAGVRKDDLNLQIGGQFTGGDALKQAEAAAERIHELQDEYYLGEEKQKDFLASLIDSYETLLHLSGQGGSEMLGSGILNILYSVYDVIQLIRDTAGEFFGKLSFIRLQEITQKFRDFTESLRLYDDETEDLNENGKKVQAALNLIFEAGQNVFTIFQNGGRIFKSFLDTLGPVTEATGKFAKSVIQLFTSVTGRFGDYLGTVDLTEEFGQVSAIAAEAINFLTGKVDSLRVMFEQWKPGAALKWLGDQFGTVRTVIADFFKTAEDGTTPFQKILNMFEGLKEKLGGLKTFFEPVTKFFQDLWQRMLEIFDLKGVTTVFEAIPRILGNVVKTIGDAIEAIFGKLSFKQILLLAKTIPKILSTFQETGILKRFKWILEDGVWAPLHNIGEFLNGFRNKGLFGMLFSGDNTFGDYFDVDIEWWIKDLKVLGQSLLLIGGGLLLIAAALAVISLIKPDDLARSFQVLTIVLAAVMGELLIFAEAINALKINPVTLVASSAAILILATALIVLAGALALFALVAKMDTMWEGMAAMAVTLVIVSAALAALANNVNGLNLIAVSAAILIFAAALIVLAVGLEAFILIAKQGDAAAVGLMAMAGVLMVVTAVLMALSAMGPVVIVAAAAMLVMSAALIVLAAALGAFILITNQGLAAIAGLGVMVASFMLLAGVLALVSLIAPQVLVAAAAMLVAGAALIVVAAGVAAAAVALTALGLGIEAVIAGFGIAIGTAIGALGAGFGAALAAVGFGIETLLASFGKGIGEGITFIAEGIGAGAQVIAVALASFGEVIGTAFESLSLKIQNGLKTISVGIDAVKESLTGVGDSIASIGTGIESFGKSVGTLSSIPLISIGSGLVELAKGIKEINKNKFTGDATNISAYVTALTSLSNLSTQIASIGTTLTTTMSTLGTNMANNLAIGIQNGAITVSNAARSLGTTITNSISGMSSFVVTSGLNMSSALARGLLSGTSNAYTAGYNLGVSAYNGASTVQGWLNTVGYNMAIGMASGLWSGAASVYSAAYSIATTATNIVSSALQVRSPSRVFARIGEYMAMGMAVGMERGTGAVVESSEQMADAAIDGVTSAMSIILDRLNSEVDANPVITPVIDMSNIEEGATQIADFLSSSQYALGTVGNISFDHMAAQQDAYDRANRNTVATIDAATLAALANSNSGVSDVTINFNGTLAQLAAVLQPAITVETKRIGEKLVNA